MTPTFRSRDQAYAWQEAHNPHAPRAGDVAPDFELYDVAGETCVRLADFRGQWPVALIFGSFT